MLLSEAAVGEQDLLRVAEAKRVVRVAKHHRADPHAVGIALLQHTLVRLERTLAGLLTHGKLDANGVDAIAAFEGCTEAVICKKNQ